MKIGEYFMMRLNEENMESKDLDKDVIDFFYQQWLTDPEGDIANKEIIKIGDKICQE